MPRLTSRRRTYTRIAIATGLAALLCAGLIALLSEPTAAQTERPPSLALIEEAVEQGRLDYETALLYKVYTIFAPDRLPPEFQSDTPSRSATLVFAEVLGNWDTLSPQTRALLTEFVAAPHLLLGPMATAYQSRPTLLEEQTFTTTHFVIHYTITGTDKVYNSGVDLDPANGVPDYVDWVAEDLETMWNAQIATMGWLEPPPDTGEGGDTRYDVYLKHIPPFYGYTQFDGDSFVDDNPNSVGVTETDAYYSYMALENDFSAMGGDKRELIRVTTAHEFNHAIQVGYDGTEVLWLMEATATWMEDEVYDDINDNYQFLDELFNYPDIALDTDLQAYHYGRWIFTRYVSEHHGGQSTVRKMWEHAVTMDNIDAVDAGLSDAGASFDEVFPPFAAANYALSSLPQNAPHTYEEADGYRGEVGSIEVEAFLPFTGPTVTYDSYNDGNEHYLEKHSTEYWVVSGTTSFSMTFAGNAGTDYAVQGALREGNRVTVKQVPLTGQRGTLVVYDPAAYDQVAIIVSNLGDTDETSSYDLTFQTTSETPPTAIFTADPVSGTIDTPFEFDASASSDAQTPGNELEVRWDWEGDYVWDTGWSTTKTISYTFGKLGAYVVNLEVRDGVDLRDVTSRTITVNNTPPTATFSVLPTVGTITTVFQFDGSASSDYETPPAALEVRWDWENDSIWDTPYTTTKQASHTYSVSNTYVIAMEVRDGQGATDTTTHSITAVTDGQPPTATFTIAPLQGSIGTIFTFDASGCEDDATPAELLEVKWDWENNGEWDTAWSTNKVITHTFATSGTHTVAMLVRDDGDVRLEGGTTRTVRVFDEYWIYLPLTLRNRTSGG